MGYKRENDSISFADLAVSEILRNSRGFEPFRVKLAAKRAQREPVTARDGQGMEIIVNGFPEEVESGTTLAQLIEQFEAGDSTLIVEVNGRFVHGRDYVSFEVSAGDKVELIHPAFGG